MSTFTLHEKDCMDGLPTIPAASVDLVVTDPPYILAAGSTLHQTGKTGTWADMMNAAYWYSAWYQQVWRILKPTGSFWTFCNWRTLPVIQKAAFDARIGIQSVLVWDKKWIGPGGNQALRPRYENVALLCKENFTINDRSIPDIWEQLWSANKPTGHPAEKPVDLISRIIQACELKEGSIVLDPFMGSGTSGVSSMECGFDFIGIEQDQQWFSIAETRIKSAQAQGARFFARNPTKRALDAGDSPAQLAFSTPEHLPTAGADSTPALRQ